MVDLAFYGLRYSFALALLVLAIGAIKRIFAKKLTAQAHYYIWFILPASTVMALMTGFLPDLSHLLDNLIHELFELSALPVENAAAPFLSQTAAPSAIHDFAVETGSSWHPIWKSFAALLLVIWAAGALFMLSHIFWGSLRARRLYQEAVPFNQLSFDIRFSQCCDLLGMKASLAARDFVRVSTRVLSPMTSGLLRAYILLPPTAACDPDLPYVLLHELTHCKQRDTMLHLMMRLFLAFNWFNPFIHYAIKKMSLDREICCDHRVLRLLNPEQRSLYGQAVLNWAARLSSTPHPFVAAVGMGSGKQELYRRIRNIAAYRPARPSCCCFSIAVLVAMVFCALTFVPSADALSSQGLRSEPDLDMREEDLSRCFGEYEGCFVLYDGQQDKYVVYQEAAAKRRRSPDSTYKIYSGLAALEVGEITTHSSMRTWDGTRHPFPEWNQSQDLQSAMKHSVNWYFQGLDESLGIQRLQDFYHRIGYGNQDLNAGLSSYWMESSLKISPQEQVMLLKDFHENKWGLKEENVQAVKTALRISEKPGAVLSGKTGTGIVNGRKINGWFIGYVESNANLYVFALNLQGKDRASGAKAMEIAQTILKDKGIW